MIGKDEKQIQDLYQWKKEQFNELRIKIPSDEFLYNKYDVIKDSMDRIKIRLNIFKGVSYSNPDDYIGGKLKMIRLKVDLTNLIKINALSFSDLAVKDNIENFDIQFELFEEFLLKRYRSRTVRKALMPIWEKYDGSKPGTYLGSVYLTYQDFVALNEYLKYYSMMTYKYTNKIQVK